jgi:hypothetical protein
VERVSRLRYIRSMTTISHSYVAQNPDPLVVTAGEVVTRGEEDQENPAWVWCVDPRGKTGWVPAEKLNETEGAFLCIVSSR